MGESAYQRAIAALGRALLSVRPDLSLDWSGAVGHWTDNLVPGIDPQSVQAELDEGNGRELEGKFRAAHSSSALAINAFARFKTSPDLLSIAGWHGFDSLGFEAKCPTGIRGGTPPNLDLFLRGPAKVLGVESKCTEHLTKHSATFSPAYDHQIKDWRRDTAWFRLMHALVEEPQRYRYLDAAQLIKHAFGLGRGFDGQDVTLVYLYWEPRNADAIPELRQHREEIARLTAEVAGARPSFRAISYPELWTSWERLDQPVWLAGHSAALRARYEVEI